MIEYKTKQENELFVKQGYKGLNDVTVDEWNTSSKLLDTLDCIEPDFNAVDYCEGKQVSSDGGSTSYYEIPEGSKELYDLINHRNMNFSIGSIFKACYRIGLKKGNDELYDLNKILFSVKQEIKRIKK